MEGLGCGSGVCRVWGTWREGSGGETRAERGWNGIEKGRRDGVGIVRRVWGWGGVGMDGLLEEVGRGWTRRVAEIVWYAVGVGDGL